MYAVFRTGGKQYRASPGQRVRVEKLEAAVGDAVEFDQVLMVGEGAAVTVGKPLVAGGKVTAKVIAQERADKITIISSGAASTIERKQGHQQRYTEVEITSIAGA